MSPWAPGVEDPRLTLDIKPLDYPANGSGDFRVSALSVRGPEGNTVTDLRYVSHRIEKGKPRLHGLPATFAGESEAENL